MAIRFPKMHVAKSTVNRILNVSDEIDRNLEPIPSIDMPSIPNGNAAGQAIDVAVNTPPDGVAAPPGMTMQDAMGPESII